MLLCAFGNILQAQAQEILTSGNSLSEIFSASTNYRASYAQGKILITYRAQSSGDSDRTFYELTVGGTSLELKNDGNLVAYDAANNVVWSSGTSGRGGADSFLRMQNDGNLVLYNCCAGNGVPIWATGTCGGVVNGCGATGAR